MSGIKDLKMLLRSMKPKLIKGKFIFSTVSQQDYVRLKVQHLMIFREQEGITLISEKNIADKQKLPYSSVWAMITLTVHSDLNAVGFLAVITRKLAEHDISVNAVSAYYHDHLFVPYEKRKKTMKLLKEFSEH